MRISDWSSDVCSSDLPDLGFLYGTILTDDVALGAGDGRASYNLCIFAEGQIDRSPTGSGVTARFALAAARGEIGPGDSCEIRGVSGEGRSEEHTSELQSLMRISYAVFCLKNKNTNTPASL